MSIPHTRTALALVITALVATGGFAVMRAQADTPPAAAAAAPAATPVEVAEVSRQTIIDWQDYSGRLEAVDRVEIRPLVSGTLTAVHFRDGARVKKGDVLFTIDPRPYAAEVERAQAQLAAAETRAGYTATELARGQRLAADNAIAKRDLDEKQNAAREAAAQVQAAQAALTAAKLNLEYTRITAPVSGRISRAEVTVGNIVAAGAGTTPLTTLVSMDKIYAAFDVDEQSFLKYVNPARAAGGEPVPVFLGLADEDGHSRRGTVASVDNRLDTSSGTIRVRAVFDNADGLLLPGLYARIRLGGGAPREAVLIDERAIGTDQDKRFVLVVDETNRTAYREVRLGARQSGLRIIENGLNAGERIVVSGLQRTRPGDTVAPKNVPMNRESLVDAPAQPARRTANVKA
ncbi:MAG: efflux RND transporter periplasmic adaptor subunit [Methyloversatilis discipulorum]|uniref:efflux RND transporter periplasmic adaptor subunit n=1 Tax=Methyloversatilis discipulorum TaxID=1119528 RepID=UPI0026F3131D|nr:efflux RND transporter periplasmic adaptor subunit [Methyloversatilis discipulorum]MBV5285145.1 efflux RND transporter periplasmic adaptor subunit [Methyloversatilis discipulorum]